MGGCRGGRRVLRRFNAIRQQGEDLRDISLEPERVDPRHLLVDHLPFEITQGGPEAAVGEEEEVPTVFAETGSEIVITPVRDILCFAALQVGEEDVGDHVLPDAGPGEIS